MPLIIILVVLLIVRLIVRLAVRLIVRLIIIHFSSIDLIFGRILDPI